MTVPVLHNPGWTDSIRSLIAICDLVKVEHEFLSHFVSEVRDFLTFAPKTHFGMNSCVRILDFQWTGQHLCASTETGYKTRRMLYSWETPVCLIKLSLTNVFREICQILIQNAAFKIDILLIVIMEIFEYIGAKKSLL